MNKRLKWLLCALLSQAFLLVGIACFWSSPGAIEGLKVVWGPLGLIGLILVAEAFGLFLIFMISRAGRVVRDEREYFADLKSGDMTFRMIMMLLGFLFLAEFIGITFRLLTVLVALVFVANVFKSLLLFYYRRSL